MAVPFDSVFGFLLFVCGNDIIMAISARRHADILRELEIEVTLRVVADHFRDTCDRKLGRNEKRLCLSDAAAQQILHGQ